MAAMAFLKALLGLTTAVAVSDLAVSSLDLEHEAKPIAKVVSLLQSMSSKLEEDQKAPRERPTRDGHLGKSGSVKRVWHCEKTYDDLCILAFASLCLHATWISHEFKHQTYIFDHICH